MEQGESDENVTRLDVQRRGSNVSEGVDFLPVATDQVTRSMLSHTKESDESKPPSMEDLIDTRLINIPVSCDSTPCLVVRPAISTTERSGALVPRELAAKTAKMSATAVKLVEQATTAPQEEAWSDFISRSGLVQQMSSETSRSGRTECNENINSISSKDREQQFPGPHNAVEPRLLNGVPAASDTDGNCRALDENAPPLAREMIPDVLQYATSPPSPITSTISGSAAGDVASNSLVSSEDSGVSVSESTSLSATRKFTDETASKSSTATPQTSPPWGGCGEPTIKLRSSPSLVLGLQSVAEAQILLPTVPRSEQTLQPLHGLDSRFDDLMKEKGLSTIKTPTTESKVDDETPSAPWLVKEALSVKAAVDEAVRGVGIREAGVGRTSDLEHPVFDRNSSAVPEDEDAIAKVPRLIADLHAALGRGLSDSEAKEWVRELDRLGEGLDKETLLAACVDEQQVLDTQDEVGTAGTDSSDLSGLTSAGVGVADADSRESDDASRDTFSDSNAAPHRDDGQNDAVEWKERGDRESGPAVVNTASWPPEVPGDNGRQEGGGDSKDGEHAAVVSANGEQLTENDCPLEQHAGQRALAMETHEDPEKVEKEEGVGEVDVPEKVEKEESVGEVDVSEMAEKEESVGEVEVTEMAEKEESVGEVEVAEMAEKEENVGEIDVTEMAEKEESVGEVEVTEMAEKEESVGEAEVTEMEEKEENVGEIDVTEMTEKEESVGEIDVTEMAEKVVTSRAGQANGVEFVATAEVASGTDDASETETAGGKQYLPQTVPRRTSRLAWSTQSATQRGGPSSGPNALTGEIMGGPRSERCSVVGSRTRYGNNSPRERDRVSRAITRSFRGTVDGAENIISKKAASMGTARRAHDSGAGTVAKDRSMRRTRAGGIPAIQKTQAPTPRVSAGGHRAVGIYPAWVGEQAVGRGRRNAAKFPDDVSAKIPCLAADLNATLGRHVSLGEVKDCVRQLHRFGEGLTKERLLQGCVEQIKQRKRNSNRSPTKPRNDRLWGKQSSPPDPAGSRAFFAAADAIIGRYKRRKLGGAMVSSSDSTSCDRRREQAGICDPEPKRPAGCSDRDGGEVNARRRGEQGRESVGERSTRQEDANNRPVGSSRDVPDGVAWDVAGATDDDVRGGADEREEDCEAQLERRKGRTRNCDAGSGPSSFRTLADGCQAEASYIDVGSSATAITDDRAPEDDPSPKCGPSICLSSSKRSPSVRPRPPVHVDPPAASASLPPRPSRPRSSATHPDDEAASGAKDCEKRPRSPPEADACLPLLQDGRNGHGDNGDGRRDSLGTWTPLKVQLRAHQPRPSFCPAEADAKASSSNVALKSGRDHSTPRKPQGQGRELRERSTKASGVEVIEVAQTPVLRSRSKMELVPPPAFFSLGERTEIKVEDSNRKAVSGVKVVSKRARNACGLIPDSVISKVPRLTVDLESVLGYPVSVEEAKAGCRELDRFGEGLSKKQLCDACVSIIARRKAAARVEEARVRRLAISRKNSIVRAATKRCHQVRKPKDEPVLLSSECTVESPLRRLSPAPPGEPPKIEAVAPRGEEGEAEKKAQGHGVVEDMGGEGDSDNGGNMDDERDDQGHSEMQGACEIQAPPKRAQASSQGHGVVEEMGGEGDSDNGGNMDDERDDRSHSEMQGACEIQAPPKRAQASEILLPDSVVEKVPQLVLDLEAFVGYAVTTEDAEVWCLELDGCGDGLTRQELCDACVSLLLRRDDKNLGSVMPALTLTSTDPRPNPGQLDVGKSRWLPPCLSPSPPDSKPPTHLFKACNGDDVRVSGGREREDGEAGAARGEGLLGGTDGVPCSRRSGVLAEVEEIENRRCSDASLAGEGLRVGEVVKPITEEETRVDLRLPPSLLTPVSSVPSEKDTGIPYLGDNQVPGREHGEEEEEAACEGDLESKAPHASLVVHAQSSEVARASAAEPEAGREVVERSFEQVEVMAGHHEVTPPPPPPLPPPSSVLQNADRVLKHGRDGRRDEKVEVAEQVRAHMSVSVPQKVKVIGALEHPLVGQEKPKPSKCMPNMIQRKGDIKQQAKCRVGEFAIFPTPPDAPVPFLVGKILEKCQVALPEPDVFGKHEKTEILVHWFSPKTAALPERVRSVSPDVVGMEEFMRQGCRDLTTGADQKRNGIGCGQTPREFHFDRDTRRLGLRMTAATVAAVKAADVVMTYGTGGWSGDFVPDRSTKRVIRDTGVENLAAAIVLFPRLLKTNGALPTRVREAVREAVASSAAAAAVAAAKAAASPGGVR